MAEAPPSYEAPADAKGKDGGGGGGGGAAAGAAAAAAPPMYTKGAITYTYVSACQACVYLVRSDGIVRRILELRHLCIYSSFRHPQHTLFVVAHPRTVRTYWSVCSRLLCALHPNHV